MGKRKALLLLVLVVSCALVGGREDEGRGWREREEEEKEGGRTREEGDWFLLQDSKQVVETDAGNMRVVRGFGGKVNQKPMHIGFITMEPKSLFIPQYMDATLTFFIRRGEARIGSIYKDELVEQQLKMGDIYTIEAGSAFYLENTGEGQRLHCICSIDTSESINWQLFQSFYIGGGRNPTSILSGFDPETLSTAFNVSVDELREVMTSQQSGPIVYVNPKSQSPSLWTRFVQQEQHERRAHLRRIVQHSEEQEEDLEEQQPKWSLRKLLISLFGKEEEENKRGATRGSKKLDSYNLYDKSPDFKNDYGWSLAVDDSDYSPLRRSGIGVYLVNLTAGSMMAPHINPTATEYGIVLRGTGNVQVVYPNGTLAMNAKVTEGDVFWVPRYFPFCQIASRSGPFEFFGFTTSAHKNRPQFLVGATSLLQSMKGPEFAAAFGVSEERFQSFIDAQRESIILPSAAVAPGDEPAMRGEEEEREGRKPRRQEEEEREGGKSERIMPKLAMT